MCTYFTLTYKCGHTQTSHRCPRSTVYIHGKNGEQVPQVNGCDISHTLGGNIPDMCIDCKMAEGHMPGVTTGADKWSLWGPKEDAISARLKMMEADVSETSNSPTEGGVMQAEAEGWEEQVRAALMETSRGQTATPETSVSSAMSEMMQVEWRHESMQAEWMQEQGRARDQDEEDDDWMWSGINNFGGEENKKRGKTMIERSAGR